MRKDYVMNKIRDGDLYKVVTVAGVSFELYYGYYDEIERESRFTEPIPIYPSFIDEPVYTDGGYPFATEMQDVCEHFLGRDGEDSCYACRHFVKGDELIGICRCEARRRINN